MSPFDFTSYREFLERRCGDQRRSRGARASLARAAGCQASYLGQALLGRVHLTEDHLMGIGEHLSLSPVEIDYLLLLLRLEKAGTEKLRAHIRAQLARTKKEGLNLKSKVNAKEVRLHERDIGTFVASWIPSTVHLLTSDPAHQSVEAIARRLSLPADKISETLHFLERIGFVSRTAQGGWAYKAGVLHVSKPSPWHNSLEASRRELAARSIALGGQGATHFSSVFTIASDDLRKLERFVAKLIEESHKVIHASGTSELACLCVDLFRVV